MLTCAQSGKVSVLEQKTHPASSARSNKKGLKETTIECLDIVNKLYIPFGTKIMIPNYGGLDSDCAEVALRRVSNFQVRHQRGIILLVLLFI